MEAIREYLLTLTAAAMICSILRKLLDKKGTPAAIGKLLTGLFMTLTVLSPLSGFSFGSMDRFVVDMEMQADRYVSEGENNSKIALQESMIAGFEAYILEEAERLGADLQVEVSVTGKNYPVPEKVFVRGDVSPAVRKKLQRWIKETLGVVEENQIWT